MTKWHMYTGTFDSSTGKWRIYIDGEIKSEADINKAEIVLDQGPLNIGNDTCCAGRFGNGAVDEVAIFNVALSPADVMEIYKKGFVMVQAVDTNGKLSTNWGRIKGSL
ncbi:LamG domain-containing protein [Candidatus Poribacteria bacterium]|nr:LamG domain-containing protein [Candidatus Poribacteria bacterium]